MNGLPVRRELLRPGDRLEVGPFVAENMATLSATLAESELFGHVKGAFTGAERDKRSLLREAHGGTLFLDEISDMDPAIQTKLLRAIEEKQARPVGGEAPEKFDVRLLAASNRDLEALARHRGNVSRVADEAGLERRHLYTLLERYRIDPDAYRGR
jgi:DNA-binding NtrC family response regulator